MELLNEVGFFETIENLQLEECIFKEVKKLLVLQAVIIFARNFARSFSCMLILSSCSLIMIVFDRFAVKKNLFLSPAMQYRIFFFSVFTQFKKCGTYKTSFTDFKFHHSCFIVSLLLPQPEHSSFPISQNLVA